MTDPLYSIGMGVAILLLLVAAIGAFAEQNQWETFKVEHHCKMVGKTASTIGTGLSTSGNVTTLVVNGKTSWLCDDGVTYTR